MTKKVLFTGPSGISCGLGNRLGIISNTTSLLHAYNDMDYKVEQRPVIPGECLNDYDLVFVTQQTIASFTAPFAHGMAWAVATVDPKKLYIVFDDWQAPEAFKDGSERNRKGQTQLEATIETLWRLDRKYSDAAAHNKQTVEKGIEILCQKNNGLLYLIPIMGRRTKAVMDIWLKLCHGVPVFYDPSYYMRGLYSYLDSHNRSYKKKERHILAALQDNSSWLAKHNFDWPIVQIGVKKLGQPRVTESDLAKIYASSWSVLSPTHKKLVNTGWFRVRNLMAAEAGSILISDDSEIFGKGYSVTPAQVESFNAQQLEEFAKYQRVTFDAFSWPQDRLLEFCRNLDNTINVEIKHD